MEPTLEGTPRRVLRTLYSEEIQKQSTPLQIPPSPFMKNLGYGTGVNVYKLDRGEMRSPWAVKRVSKRTREDANEVYNNRIQQEAAILRKLSHPNIVGFRTVVKQSECVDALALECCSTSLGDILEERREEEMGPLPAPHTLKMISDIAHALDYLHTEAHLLHGDLKSFNVLVKADFEICKLCDFGVSLPLDDEGLIDFSKNPTLRYVGTSSWNAPEIMDESEIIDSKADIFSFGLIMYETLALAVPHSLSIDSDNKSKSKSFEQTDKETSASDDFLELDEQFIAYGTRPPLPQSFELSNDYNSIVELFYCCTNELSEDRPTAKVIWKSLEQNKADEQC